MLTSQEDWRRLADYVRSARVAAGYKDRRSFAHATGISERTIGNLERHIRVSPDVLAAVENTLHWKPGSARAILGGGEPSSAAAQAGTAASEPALHYDDPRVQWVADTPDLDYKTRRALAEITKAILERDEASRRDTA